MRPIATGKGTTSERDAVATTKLRRLRLIFVKFVMKISINGRTVCVVVTSLIFT